MRYSSSGRHSSYVGGRSRRPSHTPYKSSISYYRKRDSSRDYGSDSRKIPPDDDRYSPPLPKYSSSSFRNKWSRTIRFTEEPGMSITSSRGSNEGSAGLEPSTSYLRPNSIRRRPHTIERYLIN